MNFRSIKTLVFSSLILLLPSLALAQDGPLKIFILAGQSNMVGQGESLPASSPGTLAFSAANDPDGPYSFISDDNGGFATREDVWVFFNHNSVPGTPGSGTLFTQDLAVGLGNNDTNEVGPELGFGHTVGEAYDEQVLLIKTAWGGRSLAVDFRPPSSGGTTGPYYNEIVRQVLDVLDNLQTYFPDYDPVAGFEICGFAWHQGFNDRINTAFNAEYESNLANFIRDVRADIGFPFPFVIANSGMGGFEETDRTDARGQRARDLIAAQGAVSLYPEFVGNVTTVETRSFFRDGTESPVTSGQEFHWNRNALSYLDIGLALAEAMETVTQSRCPAGLRAAQATSGIALSWSYGTEVPASLEILRNGNVIATDLDATTPSFLDTTAQPGILEYEVRFTMTGDPCDPLNVTYDACVSDLAAQATSTGITLTWANGFNYDGIEIRRNDAVIAASLPGTQTSYFDQAPAAGVYTYSVTPTTGSCPPASTVVNYNFSSIAGALLFADTFDRPNNTDLSAVDTGMSGDLSPLSYTTRTVGTSVTIDILNNRLRINGPASSGTFGGLAYIDNHNFIDGAILAGGGFSVSLDISAYSTAGSGRWMAVGVGQSLTELETQPGVDPPSHSSDLVVGYRNSTDTLAIYKDGVLDEAESKTGIPNPPTTMRIEYLLGNFAAGSEVTYNVFFDDDETSFTSGTFTWSGTDENYLSIASNLSNDSLFDNLEIRAGEANDDYATWTGLFPGADLSDPIADLDLDGVSNGDEYLFGLNPNDPGSINPISLVEQSGIQYTRRDPSLTGAQYRIFTSPDLINWTPDTTALQVPTGPATDGVQVIDVTFSTSPAPGRRFIRVEVQQ
ncbi:sialate O-acetylesterase [bacterium]|nr:sialate O-acetylesterase [bacterium]